MDYSENYSSISLDEVQSAYFGKRLISIFTAIAYVGQREPLTFLIANDDIGHSKEQVWCYQKIIISSLLEDFPSIEHVSFFSDGCAAQFKNRFTLSNMMYSQEDFGVSGNWHFFPTAHGKSPADGVGGTFKRSVYNRALSGQVNVYNALDFVSCGKSFAKKTRIFLSSTHRIFLSSEDTLSNENFLKLRWEKIKPIKGTRESHFLEPADDGCTMKFAISSKLDGLKSFKILKK